MNKAFCPGVNMSAYSMKFEDVTEYFTSANTAVEDNAAEAIRAVINFFILDFIIFYPSLIKMIETLIMRHSLYQPFVVDNRHQGHSSRHNLR